VEVDILMNNAGLGIYTKFGAEGRDKELQMLRMDVAAVVDRLRTTRHGRKSSDAGAVDFISGKLPKFRTTKYEEFLPRWCFGLKRFGVQLNRRGV
jgi:short-subunit dehydrogenase